MIMTKDTYFNRNCGIDYILEDKIVEKLLIHESYRKRFLKALNKKYIRVSRLGECRNGVYHAPEYIVSELPHLADLQEVGVFAKI